MRGIFELNEPTSFAGNTGLLYDTVPASLHHRMSISIIIEPAKLNVVLMSIGISQSLANNYFYLYLNENGKLRTRDYMRDIGWGFDRHDQSDGVVPLGEKSHVGFVKQGLSGTYYINGVASGTIRASRSNSYDDRYLGIGYDPRNGENVFQGVMSHIKLFDTIVSEDSMMEEYLTGTSSS